MSERPNEVDPLPPLQQLFVVEPSSGTQPQHATQHPQQQQQQPQYYHARPALPRQQQQQPLLRPAVHPGAPLLYGATPGAAPRPPVLVQQPPRPQIYPHHLQPLPAHAMQPQQPPQPPQQQRQQPPPQLPAAQAQGYLPQQQHPLQQHQLQQQQPSPPGASPRASPSSGSGGSGGSARLPDSPDGPDIVKVSSRSRVSSVAGKIAHDVRDGRLPRIMVAGNSSISTATKAVVQARRYLRPEGQDIAFSPMFRSSDHSRALLELAVVLMPLERGSAADNLAMLDNAGGHETRIASSSRHARAGSSTARLLRSRGINVLCSVGQEALANSVMATAHAACFLADTGRQMVVQPSHVVLPRGDQELHSIKLVVTFA